MKICDSEFKNWNIIHILGRFKDMQTVHWLKVCGNIVNNNNLTVIKKAVSDTTLKFSSKGQCDLNS